MKTAGFLGTLAFAWCCGSAFAADKYEGFLCCNMRTDGSWISDINYDENGKRVIPVGTPVKVNGFGRNRVKVTIGGKDQAIGNDYSRDLKPDEFAMRYVVLENPALKISDFPRKIQDAIGSMRITKGMTREQVLMSIGYPVSSENHNLDAASWRFWLSSFAEFSVRFDDTGHVLEVVADAVTKEKVLLE